WFTCRYRGGRRFNGFLSFGNRFSFLRFRLVSHIKDFVVGFDRFLLLASFGLIIRDASFKTFGNAQPFALSSSSVRIEYQQTSKGGIAGSGDQQANSCGKPGSSTEDASNTGYNSNEQGKGPEGKNGQAAPAN